MFNKIILWVAAKAASHKHLFIAWFEKAVKDKAFELAAKTFLKGILKTNIGAWIFFKVVDELLEEAEPIIEAAFRRLKKVKRISEGQETLEELGEANENDSLDDWRKLANKL